MARIAFNESIGTDRGEAIVGAMVVNLRQNSILLPSADPARIDVSARPVTGLRERQDPQPEEQK